MTLLLGLAITAASRGQTLVAVNEKAPEIIEKARETIFSKAGLATPACATVTTSPKFDLKPVDPTLHEFVSSFLKTLAERKHRDFRSLFHPRLKVSTALAKQTLIEIESPIGRPVNYALYRLIALNTVDGSPVQLSCDDDDYTVLAHYGYPLQFALIVQALGQRELGRVLATVVPTPEGYRFGSFHVQQWTHNGKDFQAWAQEGQKNRDAKHPEAAYVKFDLAAKLLETGNQIVMPVRKTALVTRDDTITPENWEKSIKQTLNKWPIEFVGTLLVDTGAGLLVRIRIKESLPNSKSREMCQEIAKTLAATPWGQSIEGVRCNFLLPREDPKKDGIAGGIYLPLREPA